VGIDDLLEFGVAFRMSLSPRIQNRKCTYPQVTVRDHMADSCHALSTNVEFTIFSERDTLSVSSSGGGLFGRPTTRKSPGRFLFLVADLRVFSLAYEVFAWLVRADTGNEALIVVPAEPD
jgi:hypothetical protein